MQEVRGAGKKEETVFNTSKRKSSRCQISNIYLFPYNPGSLFLKRIEITKDAAIYPSVKIRAENNVLLSCEQADGSPNEKRKPLVIELRLKFDTTAFCYLIWRVGLKDRQLNNLSLWN